MKLLIVFVNYNTTSLLVKCLNSLQSQRIDTAYQIVVVDNHSQDDSVERLRRAYPDITVLANPTNGGYAKAVNQAIHTADSEYILVLNPDIEVQPGAVDRLAQFLDETPDAGIVGGKLLNPDGTLQYSCRTFYTLPVILWRRTFLGKLFPTHKILTQHLMSDWDHHSVRDVDWMLGACLMIRRQALAAVGLMDERFFLYFEDVDWCYRMKHAGWRVCYLPDAVLIHHHQRQSAKGFWNKTLGFHLKSMVHYYDKWGNMLYFSKKYRAVFGFLIFLALDLTAINGSFYGAHLIRDSLLAFLQKPHIPFLYYHKFLLFVNLASPVILYSAGLYTFERGRLWVDELFRVGKGVLLTSLLVMAGTYLVQGYEFSRVMILTFAVLLIFVMFALRWGAVVWYNSWRKKGFNLRRTLIVGTGATAVIAAQELQKHRELGFDIVGFVRDPHEPMEALQPANTGFPIVGELEKLEILIREQRVHELILTTASDVREIISQSKQAGVDVRLVTDFHSLSVHETTFEELAGMPMVFFKGTPLFGMNLAVKRALDLVLATLGLLACAPVFMALAVLIKLESRGPVFFKQERIGRGQRPFTMFKFRSMCDQADALQHELTALNEAHGPLFKIQRDPRLTRVGKLIRKYSLDELPQLWNVLRGEMSLVGPRPPVRREVAQYDEWAQKRLEIKPGMTGLWQVSGRSQLTFDEMLKLDIYYMWNWSLTNDLKILLRTVPAVISGQGAY